MGRHSISIWFFIGALLFVYGALILASGLSELIHPEPTTVVLSDLHVAIWWGAAMLILGLVYVIRYRPGRRPGV
jgi:hypothetical protein